MLSCALFLVLFSCVLATSTCPPCENQRCPPLHIASCKVGAVVDRCGCCLVCRKAEGEVCGGVTYGVCGLGLKCLSPKPLRKGVCVSESLLNQGTTTTTATTQPPSAASVTTQPPTAASVTTQPPSAALNEITHSTLGTITTPTEYDPNKCPMPCTLVYCSDNRNKMCSVNL